MFESDSGCRAPADRRRRALSMHIQSFLFALVSAFPVPALTGQPGGSTSHDLALVFERSTPAGIFVPAICTCPPLPPGVIEREVGTWIPKGTLLEQGVSVELVEWRDAPLALMSLQERPGESNGWRYDPYEFPVPAVIATSSLNQHYEVSFAQGPVVARVSGKNLDNVHHVALRAREYLAAGPTS